MPIDVTSSCGTKRHLPPMVGRTIERALLREQLVEAEAGRGQLVIVGGEAGIGKTTIARHLIAGARDDGCLVLVGHCYDLMAAAPYGLWLDLAAGYPPASDAPELPPLPAMLASRNLDAITSQAELFAQVRPFLQALAAARPTVIVLEDAHWADPASLELLRHVASHLEQTPLLLLVTYRLDELTRQNPFYQQLPALIRESAGLRLDLKRLTAIDLTALVSMHYTLSSPDRERLVAYLVEHSEGNPFFATELLRALEERDVGGLTNVADGWHLAELDRVVVPSLVRQVIDARVARLGEETREPLAVAAVIGHDIPFDLWSSVSNLGEDALLAIIDNAIESHLFSASPDGKNVQFVHALTRSALYDRIAPPRRCRIHQTVAETLMVRSPDDSDAIAYHLQQAGDPRAPDWLIKSGERAQRAYAWLTAKDRFMAAEELLREVRGEELTRARLLYRCGRLQRYSNAANGIASLETAIRLAEVAGDSVLAADATYSRGLLHCFADEWRIGLEKIGEGIERLEALPLDIARVTWSTINWMADSLPAIDLTAADDVDPAADKLSALGINHRRGSFPWFLAVGGRIEEARRMADAFQGNLVGIGTGPLVFASTGHAAFGLGIALAALGYPGEARAAFAQAREVYDRIDHHAVYAYTLLHELTDVVIPCFTANRAERQRAAQEAQRALERAGGALPADVSARRAQLTLLYLDGRWADAREIGAESTTHGSYMMRRQLTLSLAPIAYFQGAYDEAWTHVASLLPDGPETAPGDSVLLDALMLQRLAARLSIDAGEPGMARLWLEANDRWLKWSGARLGLADNHLAWSMWLDAAGDLDGARERAEQAVTAAQKPPQPLTLLAARRLLGTLAMKRGDRSSAEEHLTAALSIADACEIPYERAESLLALSAFHAPAQWVAAVPLAVETRAIGERLNARPLLTRLNRLERQYPGLTTQPPAVPGLTARELDVLRQVARGLTDAEIGAHLFISRRTASQHLRSIYSKLDLRSRAEATRFAIEHHLT